MTNWKDIHPDFIKLQKTLGSEGKTHQQEWEERGLTYQDAKEWIEVGISTYNSSLVKHWKDYGFTSQQFKEWNEKIKTFDNSIFKGVIMIESDFAFYLKQKGYQPSHLTNEKLAQLKKEYYQAQNWLEFWYPKEGTCIRKNNNNNFGKVRNQITDLNIMGGFSDDYKKLQGSLKLERFTSLERFDCSHNQLSDLDLSDCGNLQELWCGGNKLTKFDFLNGLENAKSLKALSIRTNNFPKSDLSFLSKFTNLERLFLDNYDKNLISRGVFNHFCGSLKPLQRLGKLRELNINDTDIDSGLEYLSDSVWAFYCSADERPEAEVKKIYNLLTNEKGEVEVIEHTFGKGFGRNQIKNFPQKLQEYKQKVKGARNLLKNELQEEENKIQALENQLNKINELVFHNQFYSFSTLQTEIKRLKIQDLTIQIPLKKPELEQLTNNLKNNLGSTGKYLLDKLLKKHNKSLQKNEDISEKLEEMKQVLREELKTNQDKLQELLDKQKEVFVLEKQLESLQEKVLGTYQEIPPK